MNDIVKNNFSLKELEFIGDKMVKSRYFGDMKESSQALVKILAGREMGFEPFTSINGVHIIQGKPVISANLMASALKRTNRYNYKVKVMTDEEVSIEFFENTSGKFESIGSSYFSMEDADTAGLSGRDNWKKYPRNMLFARAMSNGIKWYCPDALNGNTVYTPDELGAVEDADGNIIDVTPKEEVKQLSSEQQKLYDEYSLRVSDAITNMRETTDKDYPLAICKQIGDWCKENNLDYINTIERKTLVNAYNDSIKRLGDSNVCKD